MKLFISIAVACVCMAQIDNVRWQPAWTVPPASTSVLNPPPIGVAQWGGPGTTYYVASSGSDSNNGTSKSTPWLHAPGMINCTGTCASTTLAAGQNVVFRGGDHYHFANSSSAPYTGGLWTISVSGTSSGCDFTSYTSPSHSTCIYFGVDPTWFSGASWSRPILDWDNPPSTSFVSSCSFDEFNINKISISGSYLTLDGFEHIGRCVKTNVSSFAVAADIFQNGDHITHLNSYHHGWTEADVACTDWSTAIFGTSGKVQIARYVVIDGSDSTISGTDSFGNVGTGWSFQAGGWQVDHSVLRYNIDGVAGSTILFSFWGNLVEHIGESFCTDAFAPGNAVHSNVDEQNIVSTSSNPTGYIYNNIIRYISAGITFSPEPYSAEQVFNNVVFGLAPPGATANALAIDKNVGVTSVVVNIFNNTVDSPATWGRWGLSSSDMYPGTAPYENNHFIGYSPAALSSVYNATWATNTPTDNGGELFQTEAVANGQGYTAGNSYAPTSGGSTINAGNDMTTFCSGIADPDAKSACTHGTTAVGYDSVKHNVILNDTQPSRHSGDWDTGAYQFQ